MPTALALSPHLDDAVFSAGGTLARLAREGWRVVVATVFTATVPDPRGFALACQLDKGLDAAVDYMALRRDEDAGACARIGAEPLWLPFAEAPHRGYGDAAALFAGLHADDGIVEAIVPVLRDLLRDLAPTLVLAPQAIGAHVDHVAVVEALAGTASDIWWWTDHPYAARPAPRASPFADAMDTLPSQDEPFAAVDLAAKGDAAAAYRSQLGFQFGGVEAARAAIAAGGPIERFRVGPAPTRPALRTAAPQ